MDPKAMHERQQRVQIVDVREAEEWRTGRIPGARWIPMDELSERVGELDRRQSVVTVCRGGTRSGRAAEFLAARGYAAENLDGGLQQWAKLGLPVRTPGDERPGKVA